MNLTVADPFYLDREQEQLNESLEMIAQRRVALDLFSTRGLPTARDEDWRLTNLKTLTGVNYPEINEKPGDAEIADLVARFDIPDIDQLVFVNGRLARNYSRLVPLSGATIGNFAQAALPLSQAEMTTGSGLALLNAAYFRDGAVIRFDAGIKASRPVHLLHIGIAANPGVYHTRNQIELADNAELIVIESFVGSDQSQHWANLVTHIALGVGAQLDHVILQCQPDNAAYVSLIEAEINENARYRVWSVSTGSRMARQDIRATLVAPQAACEIYGIARLDGEQEATLASHIIHASPDCTTREIVKTVAGDAAHSIFQGKITVAPDAQRTAAHQLSRALLLSDTARADAKPELEIYADDVKCSHGATVGDLDEAALFYLQSRGIAMEDARDILIAAFLLEALESLDQPQAKTAALNLLQATGAIS